MGQKSAIKSFIIRNRTMFIMGLIALVIGGTANLFAGLLIDDLNAYLTAIPGLIILIYSAIGLRGNIFGAMGSRLGTSMHMGTFQMNFKKGGVLRANVESAIVLTLTMSVIMGALTWIIATYMFGGESDIFSFIFISTVGGILAGAVVMAFNIIIAKEGSKRDWDVDNITAPLIAAIGDVATIPMIFLSAWFFITYGGEYLGNLFIDVLSIAFIIISIVYLIKIILQKGSKRDFSGEARRIVIHSFPVLLICLIFVIGAGMIIQNEQSKLIEYTVLLIVLTAFLNEGNALSGILTSKLSSNIHLGTLKPRIIPDKNVLESFIMIYLYAVITLLYIGFVAYLITVFIAGSVNVSLIDTLSIVFIAGMITTTILNFLSYYVAILSVKFGFNPDDHSIPITASIMDLTSAIVLVSIVSLLI